MTHPVVGTCHCRMEIQEEGGKQHVVYIAPHHKTERKTFGVIKIVIPDGDLAELAMLHITKGHAAMCIKVKHPQPNLFMTSKGLSLMGSKAAFNYCWDGILKGKWCPGLPAWENVFPPSTGRTMYVEHVTALTGNKPNEWDGQAMCMGSSAKQWSLHYAPGLGARKMQAAADNNKQWGKKTRLEYLQQHGKLMPGDVGGANAMVGGGWEVGSGSGGGNGSLPTCNTHVATAPRARTPAAVAAAAAAPARTPAAAAAALAAAAPTVAAAAASAAPVVAAAVVDACGAVMATAVDAHDVGTDAGIDSGSGTCTNTNNGDNVGADATGSNGADASGVAISSDDDNEYVSDDDVGASAGEYDCVGGDMIDLTGL